MCMGWFDTSGTSKNDNFPKVLVESKQHILDLASYPFPR